MAIDTTKKVTAISVDGVQLELVGAKEKITSVTINPPEGATHLKSYASYDKGLVLLYANMVALYEYATGETTKLCDAQVDSIPTFHVLDNKRCFIYGISGGSTVPYSSDLVFVDLEGKTARVLFRASNSGSSFLNLTDDKYILVTGSKDPYGSYSYELTSGTYKYSIETDTFTKLSGINLVTDTSQILRTDARVYFGASSYYDIVNDTFVAINKETGFSATYPALKQAVGDDIILIWDTYSYSSGGVGYYVISENMCYNFKIDDVVQRRFFGRVEFSNHNFVLASTLSGYQGLYFFNYTTKELTRITSTGNFFVNSAQWAIFQNDTFVSIDNTGQLVEIDNAGNSYISTVTTYASASAPKWLMYNNKLYVTKPTSNFGIWEYDYTTHTATEVIASNGYLYNMFVMDDKLYLSSNQSTPVGIYEVDIANQTTTQVYNAGYQFYRAVELADGYWMVAGSQKVLYNSGTGTFTLSLNNNFSMGSRVLDMGDNGMIITTIIAPPKYYPYYDGYYTTPTSTNTFAIYNKNTRTFLTTFANIGTSPQYYYSGNVLIYGNDKALALGNPLVKFEVTSNSKTSADIINNRNSSGGVSGVVIAEEDGYAIIKLTIGTTTQLVKFNYSTEQFEAEPTTLNI